MRFKIFGNKFGHVPFTALSKTERANCGEPLNSLPHEVAEAGRPSNQRRSSTLIQRPRVAVATEASSSVPQYGQQQQRQVDQLEWPTPVGSSLISQALSEIKLPPTKMPGDRNLAAGKAILEWMRQNVYTKENFKSGDKMSLVKGRAEEKARVTSARQEIQNVRNAADSEPSKRGNLALNAKGHNCSELAAAAAYLAQQLGLTAHVVGNDSHEYAVIGQLPASGLPARISDWPVNLTICDVYANIACLPQEYLDQLRKKLDKWTEAQKLLHNGIRWFQPNDPVMLSEVEHESREVYEH